MKVEPTPLEGVLIVEPRVFADERGFFMETYRAERYREHGIPDTFVQDNLSRSQRGVLRGLHYQWPRPQAKLAFAIAGEVFDVAVDIRAGSPTFGRWFGTVLSEANKRQLLIPAGFAHGFCVLSETALFGYKCSDSWVAEFDRAIRFDDPAVGVEWPIAEPILSDKDRAAPRLHAVAAADLPPYEVAG